MPTTIKPSKLNIRAYQVGFGDCFLLTFYYPKAKKASDKERHVLIDFGSTGMPEGTPADQMMRVAEDIKEKCGGEEGKLHVVVATHRHKDHISGFSTDGDGTGLVIKGLKPEVVIQPWTEDPAARKNATSLRGMGMAPKQMQASAAYISSLDDMHAVSEVALAEITKMADPKKFKQTVDQDVSNQVSFLGVDNGLPNASAVDNLKTMGKKHHYVNHGYKLNLSTLLPGVNTIVLGPPTIEQHAAIKKQKSADKDEFWMLQAATKEFWGLQAETGEKVKEIVDEESRLFPNAEVFQQLVPAHNRWFIRQIRAARGDQMLQLVRILDNAMNNTSVILLFEIGGKKLLFPGDAQIENWEFALNDPDDMELLKAVTLYKVGHHGSRNATPKSLWKCFDNKKDEIGDPKRLRSIVSTMKGKHGSDDRNTEVPRRTLVNALKKYSDYSSTEAAAKKGDLYEDITIDL
ncbi:MAG: hypothetical protein QOJ64_2515 [Acidobacteriota bacterium]|jgi:L-ascorbate metabolism protein UlaG (beta-lactamase superfamily)|nr:hypothetical protein [Acidobacteriota bacterium]